MRSAVGGVVNWAAALLLGAFLGALVTAGGGGTGFRPDSWYWPLVASCGGVGLALLGVWGLVSIDEARYRRSPALGIDYTGPGTDSVISFQIAMNLVPNSYTIPTPLHPAMTVRLRVYSNRDRRLDHVRCKVKAIHRADGAPLQMPYVDLLKWMHDDTPDHPESIGGTVLEAAAERYVDLATKVLPAEYLLIEYARAHLRDGYPLPSARYYLLVEASGRDAETHLAVPSCTAAVELSVCERGELEVELTSHESALSKERET